MELRQYLSVLIFLIASNLAIAAPSIQVKGLFKNTAIVLINGEQAILKVGKPAIKGVRLLEADPRKAVVEYQGNKQTLTMSNSAPLSLIPDAPASTPKVSSKVLQLLRQPDGMFRTLGLINGSQVAFLVDTGATLVAMNHRTADRIGVPYKTTGKPIKVTTASGVVDAYQVVLDRVRVGEIEMTQVEAAVIVGSQPDQVLLGNSFIGRVKMRQEGARLYIQPF